MQIREEGSAISSHNTKLWVSCAKINDRYNETIHRTWCCIFKTRSCGSARYQSQHAETTHQKGTPEGEQAEWNASSVHHRRKHFIDAGSNRSTERRITSMFMPLRVTSTRNEYLLHSPSIPGFCLSLISNAPGFGMIPCGNSQSFNPFSGWLGDIVLADGQNNESDYSTCWSHGEEGGL